LKNSANIAVRTMQPLPAAAVGRFRERPVSPGLRASFSALWIHQMPLDPAPPIVVVPDATIDLQWIDGILRVAGPDKEANTELVPAGATVIGFRFRPAAAASWLRIPANELVGERLPLENLWGSKASRLANQIWKSQKDGNAAAAIEAVLAEYAADGPIDAAMSAAYALIDAGPPLDVPLVPWLARALAMSERTLRRRFDESYGYGPKTLERILRYQRFLKLSRNSPSSMAVTAAEVGYSDQAHLVRESRRLSGATPKGYRRMSVINAIEPQF
jgi:AraC-like DNA-binding protein